MIIIQTKKGAVFVNEKETQVVQHDKKEKRVVIWSDKGGPNCLIQLVESITYTNEAHPTEFKDEGFEIIRLKKKLEKLEHNLSRLSTHFSFIREWYLIYEDAIDSINSSISQAERDGVSIYLSPKEIIEKAGKKIIESKNRFSEFCNRCDEEDKKQ